jgi:hypothetical protein
MQASDEDQHSTKRWSAQSRANSDTSKPKTTILSNIIQGKSQVLSKLSLQSETIYIVFVTLCVTFAIQDLEHENF